MDQIVLHVIPYMLLTIAGKPIGVLSEETHQIHQRLRAINFDPIDMKTWNRYFQTPPGPNIIAFMQSMVTMPNEKMAHCMHPLAEMITHQINAIQSTCEPEIIVIASFTDLARLVIQTMVNPCSVVAAERNIVLTTHGINQATFNEVMLSDAACAGSGIPLVSNLVEVMNRLLT